MLWPVEKQYYLQASTLAVLKFCHQGKPMLKKLGVSAFLLSISINQALAAGGHGHSHDTAHHGAVDHVDHHASAGLPQLDPSSYPSQLFWLAVVFIFMFIFFSKKTVPQMSRTIENRNERITKDLDSAERLKNEVAELQQSYEEKLSQAREESFAVFVNSEKEIKDETQSRTTKFQERSHKKIVQLEKSIDKALDSAMKDMSDVAAQVAINASEKIIGVKADEQTAKKIVKSLSDAA